MKKNNIFRILIILGICMGFLVLFSSQSSIDPVKIIDQIEEMLNYDQDITTTLNIVQVDPSSSNKIFKMKWYRRDIEDKFVMIFLEPDSEKGKGYLRIGDDLYMYLPATREFIHKNRKESIGDTDAKAENFEKMKTKELYDISYLKDEMVSKYDTYVIQLNAKKMDVSYPIQKIYVNKQNLLPVKREYFSQSGTLMQTDYYIKYEALKNGKYMAVKILIMNNLEEGKKTTIVIEDISTAKIDDTVFTKAFLENQSR